MLLPPSDFPGETHQVRENGKKIIISKLRRQGFKSQSKFLAVKHSLKTTNLQWKLFSRLMS